MTEKPAYSITGFGISLVVTLEKWKRTLNKGEYVSARFMNLSKAFDTVK